jgi:thiamine-monophosphate kinase
MKMPRKPPTKRSGTAEDEILARIHASAFRSGIHKRGLYLGVGDDAALWRPKPGFETILTCDWFLEGTHFLPEKHPPDAIGWKCLARAVSDVAAMGGDPRCFLVSLAVPSTRTGRWLDEFLTGLQRAARRFGCLLAGGDTTQRPQILLNVMVVGEVRLGRALLRSTARPGDILFTSGRLGEAEFGLRLIRQSHKRMNSRDPALKKHLYPEPRLSLGLWLAEKRLASALMDLSDGLSTDLPRLCAASGVGARIYAEKIPAVRFSHRPKNLMPNPVELALHGGDDYELLFTVQQSKLKEIPQSFGGIPLTPIGEITQARKIVLIGKDGKLSPLPNRGWDPFRNP